MLVTVLFFFAVSLMSGNTRTSPSEQVQNDQYAIRFIETLAKIDTPCHHPLRYYITSCVIGDQNACEGMDSCAYVEHVTGIVFESTLEKWGEPYQFIITQTAINRSFMNCTSASPAWRVGRQPIPIMVGNDHFIHPELQLRMCR